MLIKILFNLFTPNTWTYDMLQYHTLPFRNIILLISSSSCTYTFPNAFCSHMAYIHCTLHGYKNWKQHMFETNLYFVLLRHKLAYVKIKMLIDVDSYTWIYLGMNEIILFGECLKALRIVWKVENKWHPTMTFDILVSPLWLQITFNILFSLIMHNLYKLYSWLNHLFGFNFFLFFISIFRCDSISRFGVW